MKSQKEKGGSLFLAHYFQVEKLFLLKKKYLQTDYDIFLEYPLRKALWEGRTTFNKQVEKLKKKPKPM